VSEASEERDSLSLCFFCFFIFLRFSYKVIFSWLLASKFLNEGVASITHDFCSSASAIFLTLKKKEVWAAKFPFNCLNM